jgi:hypothetical protein
MAYATDDHEALWAQLATRKPHRPLSAYDAPVPPPHPHSRGRIQSGRFYDGPDECAPVPLCLQSTPSNPRLADASGAWSDAAAAAAPHDNGHSPRARAGRSQRASCRWNACPPPEGTHRTPPLLSRSANARLRNVLYPFQLREEGGREREGEPDQAGRRSLTRRADGVSSLPLLAQASGVQPQRPRQRRQHAGPPPRERSRRPGWRQQCPGWWQQCPGWWQQCGRLSQSPQRAPAHERAAASPQHDAVVVGPQRGVLHVHGWVTLRARWATLGALAG